MFFPTPTKDNSLHIYYQILSVHEKYMRIKFELEFNLVATINGMRGNYQTHIKPGQQQRQPEQRQQQQVVRP